MIDSSIVRVHQHAACITDNVQQDMGRSRGGLTSKIHAVVDTNGLPVHLALTPGEANDNRLCSVLLDALLPQTMLLADRAYDADWIRELARQQGAWANIPPKRNRKDPICFSPYLYRARNLIERFFNKIKQCRRVATRYDKLAANYLAFVKLASIRIWLRANDGVDAPPTASMCQSGGVEHHLKGGVRVKGYHNRSGYRQACFSRTRRGRARSNVVQQADQPRKGVGILRSAAELYCCAGGMWRGSSLGSPAHPTWPPGTIDSAGLRKTLREATEERRDRC
jgi:transposase